MATKGKVEEQLIGRVDELRLISISPTYIAMRYSIMNAYENHYHCIDASC